MYVACRYRQNGNGTHNDAVVKVERIGPFYYF